MSSPIGKIELNSFGSSVASSASLTLVSPISGIPLPFVSCVEESQSPSLSIPSVSGSGTIPVSSFAVLVPGFVSLPNLASIISLAMLSATSVELKPDACSIVNWTDQSQMSTSLHWKYVNHHQPCFR